MVDAEGIVSVEVPGGAVTRLYTGPVGLCRMDARSDAVWFLAGVSEDAPAELRVLDLRAAERGAVVVAGGIPSGTDELIIDHGRGEFTGGRTPMAFELGVKVDLTAEPRLAAYMGCEGEAIFGCLDESEEGAFRADLVEREAALGRAKVLDAKTMKALHERGRDRPMFLAFEPEARPAVSVEPAACEAEPESCGSAFTLPKGDRWLVVTGNSQGDFYHEWRHLYDPKTREFSPLTDPKTRIPAPVNGDAEFYGLVLSSSGRAYLLGDEVHHVDRGKVFAGTDACGWRQAGYLVPGITWTASLDSAEGLTQPPLGD